MHVRWALYWHNQWFSFCAATTRPPQFHRMPALIWWIPIIIASHCACRFWFFFSFRFISFVCLLVYRNHTHTHIHSSCTSLHRFWLTGSNIFMWFCAWLCLWFIILCVCFVYHFHSLMKIVCLINTHAHAHALIGPSFKSFWICQILDNFHFFCS